MRPQGRAGRAGAALAACAGARWFGAGARGIRSISPLRAWRRRVAGR